MKQFWEKNKVFLSGLLLSIAMALQEIITKGDNFSWKIIAWSAFIAGLSYASKTLRGQWATIITVILSTAATYATMKEAGNVSWGQLLLTAAIAMGMAFFSSPPKSVEYEHSAVIEKAKAQAEVLVEEKKTESLVTKPTN